MCPELLLVVAVYFSIGGIGIFWKSKDANLSIRLNNYQSVHQRGKCTRLKLWIFFFLLFFFHNNYISSNINIYGKLISVTIIGTVVGVLLGKVYGGARFVKAF